jgi:hypothetical protein
MKKLLLSFAAICVMAMTLVSCNSNTPKATADKFLNGLYHMDYKQAKEVATEDTKKMLEVMENFSSMMPDSNKANAKKIKINLKDEKIEGDKAVVTYTTSESTEEQKVDLVKQDGKWLVQYNKQEGAGGGDMNTEEPMEEPVVDSAATPAADTAAPAAQ